MGKADLHIHTTEGDGLDAAATLLDHAERETNLDVIAITEHDNLGAAHRARELWARRHYHFDLVAGVEVTTLEGHLVCLYIEKPVPSLQRVEATVAAVREQGGVCFVPHPLSWLTRSLGAPALDRLQAADLLPDGLELYNPGPAARLTLPKARRLNAVRWRLPGIGASDAHFRQAVGAATTGFAGTSAADLRAAFATGAVTGAAHTYPSLRRVGLARTLSLPLVGLRATPRALGWRRTAWSFVSRYAR